MKHLFVLGISAIFLFTSCNNTSERSTAVTAVQENDTQNFFPVTSFLKGQILEIKSNGINPLKIEKKGDKIDSTWLKMEMLDSVFSVFLTPEIDSINMSPFFTETKFHDKTINSYTFTYEPKTNIPDSISLRRWDVYVDPQSGNVRKIFMQKETAEKQNLQLSWQNKYGATILWLKEDTGGNPVVQKEETFKWNFEEEQ